MSKAILVMDMPKCCDECSVICEQYYSAVKNENFNNNMKPDNCPLKPIPEKKQHTLYSIGAWNSGYNACIDEILGK